MTIVGRNAKKKLIKENHKRGQPNWRRRMREEISKCKYCKQNIFLHPKSTIWRHSKTRLIQCPDKICIATPT